MLTTANVLHIGLLSVVLTGCSTHEVKWDAKQLRERTIEYYTDQVLDNLIRARNGQLFLHVNISQINATALSEVAGTVGGGETDGSGLESAASTAGLATKATRTLSKPFNWSLTPKHNSTVSMLTSPEVNDWSVYDAYIRFLRLPNKATTNALMTSSAPILRPSGLDITDPDRIYSIREAEKRIPAGECVPGTLRRWNGKTYYVPEAYKQEFFDLCFSLISRIKAQGTNGTVQLFEKRVDSEDTRILQDLQQKLEVLQVR
jgi:hypothetical protein